MPDEALLTVRLPVPRLALPLPETFSPPVKLIAPPGATAIVPWLVTGSLIVPTPVKPWPVGTVNGVPAT